MVGVVGLEPPIRLANERGSEPSRLDEGGDGGRCRARTYDLLIKSQYFTVSLNTL